MDNLATDFYSIKNFGWEDDEWPSDEETSPTIADEFSHTIHNGIALRSSDLLSINQLLDGISLPEGWKVEGVTDPSKHCKDITKDIAVNFATKFNLLPASMHASIEEGIMLVYRHPSKDRSLKIEIYNDGDIAGIINENKNVISVVDVYKDKDYEELVEGFNRDI